MFAVAAHHPPRRSGVIRAPELAFVRRLADDVDDVRIAARHGDANPVHEAFRQAAVRVRPRQACPGGPAVEGLVDGGLAAARFRVPGPAAEREHAGIHDVRVGRIDVDVGTAGQVVLVEHLLPALPAVHRLEEPAFLVRAPLAAERACVHDVGVARVDDEARDLLAVREADVHPVLAGVDRLVDAVADGRVVAGIALARAGVDHIGIGRGDGDGANRHHRLVVEDGLPRDAAIGLLKIPPTAPATYMVFMSPGTPRNTGTRPA